jgi:hypothetical protein
MVIIVLTILLCYLYFKDYKYYKDNFIKGIEKKIKISNNVVDSSLAILDSYNGVYGSIYSFEYLNEQNNKVTGHAIFEKSNLFNLYKLKKVRVYEYENMNKVHHGVLFSDKGGYAFTVEKNKIFIHDIVGSNRFLVENIVQLIAVILSVCMFKAVNFKK